MSAINFELSTPLSYANGTGAPIECGHIELREPTGKVAHICSAIEGLVQSSLMNLAETLGEGMLGEAKEAAAEAKSAEAVDDASEKDGESIWSLMASSGADMNKITLHFRDLFKEVAWMGGEKQITAPRLDEMTYKDLRKMMGVYAANFILS